MTARQDCVRAFFLTMASDILSKNWLSKRPSWNPLVGLREEEVKDWGQVPTRGQGELVCFSRQERGGFDLCSLLPCA